MNWIDGLIVLAFGIYIFEGFRRGFIEQLLELVGFIFIIFLAVWTYAPLANWIAPHFGIDALLARPIGFIVDWIVLWTLYSIILHIVYELLPEKWRKNKYNRYAGVLPAVLKGYIVISILVTLMAILPITPQLKQEVSTSSIGSRFVNQSSTVEGYMDRLFGQNVRDSLTFLTVPPQNEEIIHPDQVVDLKFKTTDVKVDTAAEQQMFALVNKERAKIGLPALVWDERLAIVARAHSTDMFARGYFGHNDPDGHTPFDRISTAGIGYEAAGENLAFAANVLLAHNGLMNSPGHRANILDKDYGHVGIGVINGGIYGEMFAQDFTN